MSKKIYSPLQRLMQKIASSRPGGWLSSVTMRSLDHQLLKLTGGRSTLTGLATGLPVVILTTTGARSGLPRTLPLLYIRDEQDPTKFALIASNWGQSHHPAWYFNLKANPRAACSIDRQIREYIAHEAVGEEYERFWQYAEETYLGYPLYQQRAGERRIPILVMMPV